MKTSTIILICVGAFFLLLGGCGTMFTVSKYNKMVTLQENVNEGWGQVENVYQRRSDLIPNLVNVVKGYASHERETLEGVIEARAKATQTTIDPSNLTPQMIQTFQANQDMLSSALSKLMVVVERYPDLKANENFMNLQVQLEGTENRISVERKRFNTTVKGYNTYIKKFPNNLVANGFNFEERNFFKAEEGSEKAPEINF